MKKLSLEATKNTPYVKGNLRRGTLLIEGKSYPEDADKFYNPIIDWCESILGYKYPKLEIEIKISYMNSATGKMLLEFYEKLAEITKQKEIVVNWHYDEEDPDMEDLGEAYLKHFGEFVNVFPHNFETA